MIQAPTPEFCPTVDYECTYLPIVSGAAQLSINWLRENMARFASARAESQWILAVVFASPSP